MPAPYVFMPSPYVIPSAPHDNIFSELRTTKSLVGAQCHGCGIIRKLVGLIITLCLALLNSVRSILSRNTFIYEYTCSQQIPVIFACILICVKHLSLCGIGINLLIGKIGNVIIEYDHRIKAVLGTAHTGRHHLITLDLHL